MYLQVPTDAQKYNFGPTLDPWGIQWGSTNPPLKRHFVLRRGVSRRCRPSSSVVVVVVVVVVVAIVVVVVVVVIVVVLSRPWLFLVVLSRP